MARIFAITAVKESVQLDKTGRGEIAFTVTNTTPRPLRPQITIKPQDDASSQWFSLKGDTERDLAPNATQQVTVQAKVPVGTPPGRYRITIDAVDTSNPDENFTEGPLVTFEVKEKPSEKPFPWWIAATVGGAAVVIGTILMLFP